MSPGKWCTKPAPGSTRPIFRMGSAFWMTRSTRPAALKSRAISRIFSPCTIKASSISLRITPWQISPAIRRPCFMTTRWPPTMSCSKCFPRLLPKTAQILTIPRPYTSTSLPWSICTRLGKKSFRRFSMFTITWQKKSRRKTKNTWHRSIPCFPRKKREPLLPRRKDAFVPTTASPRTTVRYQEVLIPSWERSPTVKTWSRCIRRALMKRRATSPG